MAWPSTPWAGPSCLAPLAPLRAFPPRLPIPGPFSVAETSALEGSADVGWERGPTDAGLSDREGSLAGVTFAPFVMGTSMIVLVG